jgi:hypothetical protein
VILPPLVFPVLAYYTAELIMDLEIFIVADLHVRAGNIKGGSIIVPLTSCLTG